MENKQSILVECPKCGYAKEIPYCETSGKYTGTCDECGSELSSEDEIPDWRSELYAKLLLDPAMINPKDLADRVRIRRDIRDINNWLLSKVKDKSIRRGIYVYLALMYWLEGKDDKVMETARTLCEEMETDSDTAEDIIFYFNGLNEIKLESRADEYFDYRDKTYFLVEMLDKP